jgi:hypothetical protein
MIRRQRPRHPGRHARRRTKEAPLMSGIAGLPPVPMYLAIEKNEQQYAQKTENTDAAAKAGIAYFEKQAPALTSPQALLGNYRALQVVLSAFGMSSDINNTGILKDLMTQNPSDPKSLVQQLASPLYTRFAQLMSNWNPPPFSSASVVQTIVNQYTTNQFEQNQGQQMPGMQQALYFTRTIASATSLQQIMSDPTLLNVVETATNQPPQFGLLNYDQQVSLLTKAVPDVTKFQNPEYVRKFVEKYLVMNQMSPPPVTVPSTVADLLSPSGGTSILSLFGISTGSANPGSLLSVLT